MQTRSTLGWPPPGSVASENQQPPLGPAMLTRSPAPGTRANVANGNPLVNVTGTVPGNVLQVVACYELLPLIHWGTRVMVGVWLV